MPLGREWAYKPGDPWAICDRCAGKYRRSQIQREWNNLRVCQACFETKHPQLDGPRVKGDRIVVRDARPRPVDTFRAPHTSTTLSSSAASGATTVALTAVGSIAVDDSIQVVCKQADADGNLIGGVRQHQSLVTAVSDPNVTMRDGLPQDTDAGTAVTYWSTPATPSL